MTFFQQDPSPGQGDIGGKDIAADFVDPYGGAFKKVTGNDFVYHEEHKDKNKVTGGFPHSEDDLFDGADDGFHWFDPSC